MVYKALSINAFKENVHGLWLHRPIEPPMKPMPFDRTYRIEQISSWALS